MNHSLPGSQLAFHTARLQARLQGRNAPPEGAFRFACGRSLMLLAVVTLVALGPSPLRAASLAPGDIIVPVAIGSSEQPPSILRVDPQTGDRSLLAGAGLGEGPEFVSPAGIALQGNSTLFVADSRLGAVFKVDLRTGDRSIVSGPMTGDGQPLQRPQGIWLETASSLLLVDELAQAVFRVDLGTGERTVVTSPTRGSGLSLLQPQQVIVEDDGQILVTAIGYPDDGIYGAIVRVDSTTGDRAILSDVSHGLGPAFETVAGISRASDGTIYVTDNWNSRLYEIDADTGDRALIVDGFVSQPVFYSPYAIGHEADGTLLVTDLDDAGIFRIDPETGTVQRLSSAVVGGGPWLHWPLGTAVVQVPEPATWRLAACGVAIIFLTAPFRGSLSRLKCPRRKSATPRVPRH